MVDWTKVKIIVFDFDRTLTNTHTRGVQNLRHLTDDNIFYNFSDYEFVECMIDSLIEMGYYITIASFADNSLHKPEKGYIGGQYLINKYLDTLFGKSRKFLKMNDIFAYYATDKNTHLNKIINYYNNQFTNNKIIKNDEVLLIDDQSNNILQAKLCGYQGILINNDHGINEKIWNEQINPTIINSGIVDLVSENFEKVKNKSYK